MGSSMSDPCSKSSGIRCNGFAVTRFNFRLHSPTFLTSSNGCSKRALVASGNCSTPVQLLFCSAGASRRRRRRRESAICWRPRRRFVQIVRRGQVDQPCRVACRTGRRPSRSPRPEPPTRACCLPARVPVRIRVRIWVRVRV